VTLTRPAFDPDQLGMLWMPERVRRCVLRSEVFLDLAFAGITYYGAPTTHPVCTANGSPKTYLKSSDCDARIDDAVRVDDYKLQEVGDDLGLHFSIIRAISQATSHWEYKTKL